MNCIMLLNASGFTESARKRDQYDTLHDYLKDQRKRVKAIHSRG